MRRLIIPLITLLLVSTNLHSQAIDSIVSPAASALHTTYSKKAKAFKTAGFVMLGAGVLLASGSYLLYANNGFNGPWEHEGMFTLGGIMAIGSIPMFIVAGANKRKARLVLKGEPVSYLGRRPYYYPALAFSINL